MGGYTSGLTLNNPDFNSWLSVAWGSGASYETVCGDFYGASNFVFGQNPPYYLDDFASVNPKFFGAPTAVSGCGTVSGSNTVTLANTNGLNYGQFVQAFGVFPPGTVITGFGTGTVILNNAALATNANATLQVYESAPIPAGVVLMYLNLALNSLVQARWQEMWWPAMALFIAHYCTLYARSDSSEVFESLQTVIHGEVPAGTTPGTTYTLSSAPPGGVLQALTNNGIFQTPGVNYTLSGATITLTTEHLHGALYATWLVQETTLQSAPMNGAQIAAQGLAFGIQTSKSVGDVSVGYAALTALESWGAWNLTSYGQLLVTQAKIIGMGPALIY